MMFNQAPRYAFLLALAVGPGDYHAQGFHVAVPVVSAGRGLSCRGTCNAALRPHAVRGCTCGACAAAAGLIRETLGGRTRSRGCGAVGVGEGGGELPTAAAAAAAIPEFDLADKTVEELWMRVKKQLISVGKGGVKESHVRSLNTLIAAHTLVKVKINILNADLAEVGLELAGKGEGGPAASGGGDDDEASPAVDVSVVTFNSNQKTILFANTEFLAAQARGEVFNAGNSVPKGKD